MSFSYNENRIAASGVYTVDFVRFQLDDTIQTDPITNATVFELSDEVITALYNQTSSSATQTIRNYVTAIEAAKYLKTKYSKQPASFSSAGTSITYGERKKAIQELIDRLTSEVSQYLGSDTMILYPNRNSSYCYDCL